MIPVLQLRAEEELFVIKRRVIGRALIKARQNAIRGENVECVDILGDLREMIPACLLGIIGSIAVNTHIRCNVSVTPSFCAKC